jgi:tetrahydromethanopterin S-methyltransferase subunit A
MKKIKPLDEYPPEEGCYLRGNDFSPVAVVVILNRMREETPPDIELITRVAIESGAALAGTLQTENIGLEKVICNVVANPNIRYIVLCGPESPGHLTGEALEALLKNGVDSKKKIIGTNAPTPYLFNIDIESVERFRTQVKLINLLNEGRPEIIKEAVCACYQEKPTKFRDYELYDHGAIETPPICKKITWRVTHPEREPKDEDERKQIERLQAQMKWIKKRLQEKKRSAPDPKGDQK